VQKYVEDPWCGFEVAFEVPLLLDLAGAPQLSVPSGLPVLVVNDSLVESDQQQFHSPAVLPGRPHSWLSAAGMRNTRTDCFTQFLTVRQSISLSSALATVFADRSSVLRCRPAALGWDLRASSTRRTPSSNLDGDHYSIYPWGKGHNFDKVSQATAEWFVQNLST
jgi:hypothetical protein